MALPKLFEWPDKPPNVPKIDHGWLVADTRKMLADHLGPKTLVAIEIGSWLGKSARYILERATNAHLYCVDTWAGSAEHHRRPEWARMLPRLYETFLVNCWDLRHRLTPLRMRSVDGMRLLAQHGVKPDLVYIDASHEYHDVMCDLETALDLFPDAAIVGDDWKWRDVRRAVVDTAKRRDLKVVCNGKAWSLDKSGLR